MAATPATKARLRPATEEDADAVLELMRDYYTEDGYPFSFEDARRCFLEFVGASGWGRIVVIVLDDDSGPGAQLSGSSIQLVGYLILTFGYSFEYRGRDAFVDELYLRPDARGRGLGWKALEEAESLCRAAGVRTLHLEVERGKADTIELYRRFGFTDNQRRLMSKALPR